MSAAPPLDGRHACGPPSPMVHGQARVNIGSKQTLGCYHGRRRRQRRPPRVARMGGGVGGALSTQASAYASAAASTTITATDCAVSVALILQLHPVLSAHAVAHAVACAWTTVEIADRLITQLSTSPAPWHCCTDSQIRGRERQELACSAYGPRASAAQPGEPRRFDRGRREPRHGPLRTNLPTHELCMIGMQP